MISAENNSSVTLVDNKALQKEILAIPGWLSLEEGFVLYRLAGKFFPLGKIVEIGSFQGKSTVFMGTALSELKGGSIISIDPHLGKTELNKKPSTPTYKEFLKNIRLFQVNKYIHPLRQTSEEANKKWKDPIGLLFIDALHEYEFVKQDLELWLPYVAESGIVVCHDAYTPYRGVYQAVEERLIDHPRLVKIGIANSLIFGVLGSRRRFSQGLILEWNKIVIKTAIRIWQTAFIPESFRDLMAMWLKMILIKNII